MYSVYKIVNKITKQFYIGSHKENGQPYYGSGKVITNQVSLFGKEHFERFIIESFDSRRDAQLKEKQLIAMAIDDPLCLNMRVSSAGGDTTDEQKQKISSTLVEWYRTTEGEDKRRNQTARNIEFNKNYWTEEQKHAHSQLMLEYNRTPEGQEAIAKRRESLKALSVSNEVRENQSVKMLNWYKTDEGMIDRQSRSKRLAEEMKGFINVFSILENRSMRVPVEIYRNDKVSYLAPRAYNKYKQRVTG